MSYTADDLFSSRNRTLCNSKSGNLKQDYQTPISIRNAHMLYFNKQHPNLSVYRFMKAEEVAWKKLSDRKKVQIETTLNYNEDEIVRKRLEKANYLRRRKQIEQVIENMTLRNYNPKSTSLLQYRVSDIDPSNDSNQEELE